MAPMISLHDPLVWLAGFAGLIFIGYAGNLIFRGLRFNDVLLLMALGVVVGPVLGWVGAGTIEPIANIIAPLALILILFDGGLALKLSDFRKGLGPAVALAVFGFALAAFGTAAILVYEDGVRWATGFTFGCIVGGTSSVIVLSSLAYMRSTRATDTALALESALTDIFVVVAVFTLVGMVIHDAHPSPVEVGRDAGILFSVSILAGAAAGFLWLALVPAVRDHPFGYMLTLGAALAVYVGTETGLRQVSGGGGALAVLAFGIVLGNGSHMGARMARWVGPGFGAGIKRFQGEISFLVRTFFFIELGILVDPALLDDRRTVMVGLLVFAALAVARYLAVAITVGKPWLGKQGWIMWVMMPRGLAAAVMAGVPAAAGMPGSEDFVAYAFIVVAASNVLTTMGGFILGGRKPKEDVMEPVAFTPSRVEAFAGGENGPGQL